MSRRAPGEGCVHQRQDGRWQASLQLEGRRKTVYGKTRQEALRKLEGLRRLANLSGTLPDPGRKTVGDLLDAWLETATHRLKPTTLAHYRLLAESYIRPALGNLKLSALRPDRVQAFYSKLQTQGHHRVAQLCHCLLHQACDLAVRWGWLGDNPTERAIAPSYRRERKTVWTLEETRRFLLEAQGHWLWPLWVLALVSGCRPGELLGLGWDDVDWERGCIRVRRTLQWVNGAYRLVEPKTSASYRTLALPKEGLAALARQREQQAAWREAAGGLWPQTGLVFTHRTGRPLDRFALAHALAEECERLGITPMTPHGLRHLHASLLLKAGLPVPLVSQRLGHANPGVTMTVYAHALESGGDGAVQALEGALRW